MILKIAGVVVETVEDTVDIDIGMTYIVDELRCQVVSETRPSYEASVEVSEGAEVLFSGTITGVALVDKGIWDITALDNTRELDSLLVVEEYSNQSASAIVTDLMTKYAPAGFSAAGVISGAPVVEFWQFDYKRLSECFKELCDYVGWQWYVDPLKVVHFFSAESMLQPAPMVLDAATAGQIADFRLSINTENIRNRVFVRGGTMLSSAINLEFKYDGKMRAWTIPYKPSELKIYVSEVQRTVGIENIHDPALYDFLLNYQEQRITMGTNYTSPAEGATIRQNFKHPIDVITVAEDIAAQNALAAITGGDGVREHTIEDNNLVTLAAAEAAGEMELRKWADPEISGTFETPVMGWEPGQLLRVDMPERGLSNTYMVQKVHMAYRGQWYTEVQFGGRLISVADFLQAIVSKQKSAQAQTSILQKYTYVNEKITVTDSLITAARTGHWVCGDPDAICGEVVCLA